MNIELVTIGTELLLGFTVDTNGAEIARSLADNGVQVVRRSVGGRPTRTPFAPPWLKLCSAPGRC